MYKHAWLKTMLILCGLLILTSVAQAESVAQAKQVYHYTLPNGLQLYVKPDNRAPVVVSQVWYKVGSSYEPSGMTGVSHLLEHLMFRGTNKFPDGYLKRVVAEHGGQQNAMTSRDFTAYYQELTADQLALSFKLEADRMLNLNITKKAFEQERQIVMEERRMRTEDNPQSRTLEQFNSVAYIASPYHHPVVGWMNDLKQMTLQDAQAWYKRWYMPNNAIVVVVGDVQPAAVFKLAKQYFGPVKPGTLTTVKPATLLQQLGVRTIIVNVPAKLPWLLMGYHVPTLTSDKQQWEPYALAVLAGILSAGDSARLPRELVRGSQIASSAGADYDPFARLPDLFMFYGTPAAGKDLEQLKSALFSQIKALQTKPVTAAELARIKAQVIASKVYAKDSVIGQAIEIGRLESVGLPWQTADNFISEVQKITPQQVEAVAKKILSEESLNYR